MAKFPLVGSRPTSASGLQGIILSSYYSSYSRIQANIDKQFKNLQSLV